MCTEHDRPRGVFSDSSEDTTDARRQDGTELLRSPQLLGIFLCAQLFVQAVAGSLGEARPLRIDQDAIACLEVTAEFADAVDFSGWVVGPASDESVGQTLSIEIQTGVPQKLAFHDIAKKNIVRT